MIKYVFILLQILFLLRFHLELSRANAHVEPISTIRRLTDPLVLAVKKLIPFAWAKKFAALKIAFLIAFLGVFLMIGSFNFINVFVTALVFFVSTWLMFLQYGMFLYVIGSWIRVPALERVNYLLHNAFEPILRPIQNIIPSFGGIDFSPMIALFGLSFLAQAFYNVMGF